MNATIVEAVPTTWDERDVAFFRITAELFTPAYVAGGSALLASYDYASDDAVIDLGG